VKCFFDWIRDESLTEQPWLMLGKGPSFGLLSQHDVAQYQILSLNHVVRERPVTVAHIIDLDVVTACANAILDNARVLVVPWFPHVDNRVGDKSLEYWITQIPVLRQLEAEQRLLWYDLSTSKIRHGAGPVVKAKYFSAEAALSLLALSGVKCVRSLGVDGGSAYGSAFVDIESSTKLNNGHQSFDLQFQGFANTISKTGVDYAPLNIESPVRVFVGSQEEQMLAVQVLEYSIRRHASMTVQVMPLHRSPIIFKTPKEVRNRPRTPFSFQRFTIPQLAGYRGRAIYVDSDMMVFKDIREVWTLPFDGADVLAVGSTGSDRRPQFSVMMLDCDRLRWTPDSIVELLDSGQYSYEQLMYEMKLAQQVKASIPPEWNSLEHYEAGRTGLLHYTDMHSQPWISRGHRWGGLWVKYLLQAVDDGFITREEVADHVQRGWVRPSLLQQIDARAETFGWRAPLAMFADKGYVPPYKKMGAHGVAQSH